MRTDLLDARYLIHPRCRQRAGRQSVSGLSGHYIQKVIPCSLILIIVTLAATHLSAPTNGYSPTLYVTLLSLTSIDQHQRQRGTRTIAIVFSATLAKVVLSSPFPTIFNDLESFQTAPRSFGSRRGDPSLDEAGKTDSSDCDERTVRQPWRKQSKLTGLDQAFVNVSQCLERNIRLLVTLVFTILD